MVNKGFTAKHNPIKLKKDLSMFSQVKIELNEQGVLLSNGKIRRVLKPGDNLNLDDRLAGGLTMFIIDHAPHETTWYVKPISKDEPETFPLAIRLKYRVLDARRMVEEDIKDTEAMVVSALTPLLRKEARKYSLYQYEDLENVLEDLLDPTVLASFGLELMYKDVEIEFTEDERNDLKALVRAMNVPQQTIHTTILPTMEDDAKFHASVTVNYKVVDYNRLPTKTLEEAEKWLWRRVQNTLHKESRKYSIKTVDKAEQSLQDIVEHEIYSDHGLEIVSIQVSIDVESLEKTAEMGALQDQIVLEKYKAAVERVQQERAQQIEKGALEFYGPMIKAGQWDLLAVNLIKNKMDAKEVLTFLTEQERAKLQVELDRQDKQFAVKVKVLDYALNKGDGLSEKMAEEVVESAVRDIGSDLGKSLPEKSESSGTPKSPETPEEPQS